MDRQTERHQHIVEALTDLFVVRLAIVVEGLRNLN